MINNDQHKVWTHFPVYTTSSIGICAIFSGRGRFKIFLQLLKPMMTFHHSSISKQNYFSEHFCVWNIINYIIGTYESFSL